MPRLRNCLSALRWYSFAIRGMLDLDAPVVRYLPYFHLNDARYPSITVRQMMMHYSGMPDTEEYGWDKPKYDDAAVENYVRSITDLSLESEPGTA